MCIRDSYAAKHLPDNVSEETKIARLNELIKLQTEVSAEQNKNCLLYTSRCV